MNRRRLLWTDDDGPGRFQYAALRLGREGWDITWARSVDEAAHQLSSERFDALVLDQMLPLQQGGREATVWGGATLFRWLRGRGVAPGAPTSVTGPASVPLAANHHIPVAIVSAYRHDEVEHAIADASGNAPPHYVGKPLDITAMKRALESPEPPQR